MHRQLTLLLAIASACAQPLSGARRGLCPTTSEELDLGAPLPWGDTVRDRIPSLGETRHFSPTSRTGDGWSGDISVRVELDTSSRLSVLRPSDPTSWQPDRCGPEVIARLDATSHVVFGDALEGSTCEAVLELSDATGEGALVARCASADPTSTWSAAHPPGANHRGWDVRVAVDAAGGRADVVAFSSTDDDAEPEESETLATAVWGSVSGRGPRVWTGEPTR